jgi:hypothetical protein
MKVTTTLILFVLSLFSYSQTLSDSLKAHFKFDGNLLDASPFGEHLSAATGISYENISGNDDAAFFDGNRRLISQNPFDNSDYTAATISLWLNTTNSSSSLDQTLIQGAFMGFGIKINIQTGTIGGFYTPPASASLNSSTAINDGLWHHVVLSNTGTTTRLYIDGKLEGSKPETMQVGNAGSNNKLYLGKTNLDMRPFTGSLNDVRIYNRSLSDIEIDSLFNMYCFKNQVGFGLKTQFKLDSNLSNNRPGNYQLVPSTGSSFSYSSVDAGDLAINFNGSSRLEGVGSYDNSSFQEEAVSLWFKSAVSTTQQALIHGTNMGFAVYLMPPSGQVRAFFDSNTNSNDAITSTSYTDNKWHHVLAQNDGSTTYLYIDGVLITSVPESLFTGNGSSNNKLHFGQTHLAMNPFTGSLNEVRIYDRMLKPCEIDSLFQANKPPLSTFIGKNNLLDSAKIYPNPSKGNVTILLQNWHVGATLRLRNMLGQVIQQHSIKKPGKLPLTINNAPGIYFVEVELKGERSISKLIKQ